MNGALCSLRVFIQIGVVVVVVVVVVVGGGGGGGGGVTKAQFVYFPVSLSNEWYKQPAFTFGISKANIISRRL